MHALFQREMPHPVEIPAGDIHDALDLQLFEQGLHLLQKMPGLFQRRPRARFAFRIFPCIGAVNMRERIFHLA